MRSWITILALVCTLGCGTTGQPITMTVGFSSPSPQVFPTFPLSGHTALDSHDGDLVQFGKEFYLYGTSYACGFEWIGLAPNGRSKPWCGFTVQRSSDLVHWKDRTLLFDPTPYQGRCRGVGCFNPRVIYNIQTKQYVLWWAQLRGPGGHGYSAAVSNSPMGPFVEVPGSGECCSTLNHPTSDGDPFVDIDATAYFITDDHDFAAHTSQSVIRRLNADYTTEVPGDVVIQHPDAEEAQSLFYKAPFYYFIDGTDCGYCTQGARLRYYTSLSMQGPWTDRGVFSKNDCGGQPTQVSLLLLGTKEVYVMQSDLWLGKANEAGADQRWDALLFASDGTLIGPTC